MRMGEILAKVVAAIGGRVERRGVARRLAVDGVGVSKSPEFGLSQKGGATQVT